MQNNIFKARPSILGGIHYCIKKQEILKKKSCYSLNHIGTIGILGDEKMND
jgi:hypothetical protein